MRLLQIFGLWTAVSVPVTVLVGHFLAAGAEDRPQAARAQRLPHLHPVRVHATK